MENLRRNKGITIVALVITIIILLILAGISIQAITNTGLFANTKRAKEKSMEGQLKEEISLAIQDIEVEEISKGNGVTLETIAGGQLENKLKDITAELDDDKINGEYSGYEYTIDSKFNVKIENKVTGISLKFELNNDKEYTSTILKNNELDRKKLADIVFSNKTEKEKLDSLTFEYVVKEIKSELEANQKLNYEYIILDVPLLFESKLDEMCDYIIVVIAPKTEKIKRICKRDNLSEEKALQRLNNQENDEFYIKKCDFIIENVDNEKTAKRVNEIILKLQ